MPIARSSVAIESFLPSHFVCLITAERPHGLHIGHVGVKAEAEAEPELRARYVLAGDHFSKGLVGVGGA